ncbi:MAG TPA: hypothetical protein VMK53_02635 [Gemmatimonadales bacterium]|nr:hypothetical protein [Gemmatimonadales bacterium]
MLTRSVLTIAAGLLAALPLAAQEPVRPTQVRVHVVSRDAKLIGSAVGGIWVTIRDATTGRTLAEGLHTGGTGDLRRIMQAPRLRDSTLFTTEGAARFTATIPLTRPTPVIVSAHGPLNFPDQAVTVTKQLLLVPGEDLLGDGVVLEMHGLIVEVLEPTVAALTAGEAISIRARVRMMCSCPTGPDQLWSAGTVRARLLQDDLVVEEAVLPASGEGSLYAGRITAPSAGRYVLEVLASDPARVNAGVARREVVVRP